MGYNLLENVGQVGGRKIKSHPMESDNHGTI